MERARLTERLWLFGSFLRLPLFGWTLTMPLFGALSVPNAVGYRTTVPFIMTIPFHIVFAVVNDLATIDLDRQDPRKAARPLVSGAVRPTMAKALVAVAVLVAFPADALLLDFEPKRSVTLAVAFLATAAYNVAGKHTLVPPLMDFLLGVGSAALIHYTMLAIHGTATVAGLIVEAAVIIYIILNNGVHFGVRDISSDFEYGARTTPILFGVRPQAGAPYLPRRFVVYACSLQVLLTIVTLGPVLTDLSHGEASWSAVVVALAFVIGSYAFIYPAMDAFSASTRYVSAYLQSLCGFGSVAALATARYGGMAVLGIFAILTVPLFVKQGVSAVRVSWRQLDARRGNVEPGGQRPC